MTAEVPAYMKIPGLGVLLLNVGAISALAAIWTELDTDVDGKYKLALGGAFLAFVVGIGLAVLSLCCQFVYDAISAAGPRHRFAYKAQDRFRSLFKKLPNRFPVWILGLGVATCIALCLFLPIDAKLLTWCLFLIIASFVLAGALTARRTLLSLLEGGKYGASGLGIVFFGSGLIIAMVAWSTFQLGQNADNPPGLAGSGGPARGDVTYNIGCGGRTGIACPQQIPAPVPNPAPQAPVGGTNVHIHVHLGSRGQPPGCPARPPCRRCPDCPPPERVLK